MTDISSTAADVRALQGCTIRRFTSGSGGVTPGQPVYLSADDTVDMADASTAAGAACIGVAVACNGASKVVAVSGDRVDVALFGPVAGYLAMTYGAKYYVDDDAGVVCSSAGSYSTIIGVALSATVLLVNPIYVGL
jgi:hypothetical protein